jgi:hypothetical protein
MVLWDGETNACFRNAAQRPETAAIGAGFLLRPEVPLM